MVILALAVLVVLVAGGVYIAAVLGLLGAFLGEFFAFFPLLRAVGNISWTASTDFVLVSVPLFILMGEILLRSGMAEDMFESLDKWVNWMPGGLMHTNIASCAMFAATSGSSVATAATIGTVSIPNIERRGYNPPLFLGSLAAGGTLGILIPPSINMIIYAVLTETFVGDLYLAGLIPGILLAAMFSVVILIACLYKPSLSGTRTLASWSDRLTALRHLIAPIVLFVIVVGSIYAGVATPTEAASLGVIGSLILALARRRLTWLSLLRSFEGTMKTTAMVMLIVLAAFFLNFVLTNIGVTRFIDNYMKGLDISPLLGILAIVLLYLILGMFMETLSLMIATLPIVFPVAMALGFDKVWFGVLFIVLIEAALITPPIGMNLFVVQAIREKGPFRDVVIGSLPFLVAMLVLIGLLIAFPELATWAPEAVRAARS